MNPELWPQIESIFHAALELSEHERSAFVETQCAGNTALRSEVQDLLRQEQEDVSWVGESISELIDWTLQLNDDPSYLPPDRIGPYSKIEYVNKGGMGEVWKYLREDTGQPVAIKFLNLDREVTLRKLLQEHFVREIASLASLRHPYIVSFHDAGVLPIDGVPWLVMDFVEEHSPRMSFTEYLRQPGWDTEKQLKHFRMVCEAVLHAHQRQTVHRDLKPSNILIAVDGSPRIVDFGIARKTRLSNQGEPSSIPTVRILTPGYAPPEWENTGQWTELTDIYAVGVMLYEVLAGRHPYRVPGNPPAFLNNEAPPERPSSAALKNSSAGQRSKLSKSRWRELDKLCLTAMEPDPKLRYGSVDAVIRDIDHYLSEKPLEAVPATFRYLAGKFLRAHRNVVAAATTMVLLIAGLTGIFTWRLAQERDRALAEAARTRRIQEFLLSFMGNGAAPSETLTVKTALDRSVASAATLQDDPETQSEIYSTLGSAYEERNDLSKADELLTLGLKASSALPDSNEEKARSILSLGVLRGDESQYTEAEKLINQSLALIQKLQISSDDPLPGLAKVSLGKVLVQEGANQRAISVLQPLTEQKAIDDSATANLLNATSFLAVAQQAVGNLQAADELNRRALDLAIKVYGSEHPRVAEILSNVATVEATHGNTAEAEKLYDRAASILAAYYGPKNPETLQVMSFSATMALRGGNYGKAVTVLHQLLPLQLQEYGNGPNAYVAFTHNSLGQLALAQGDLSTAEKEFDIVVTMNEQLFGASDLKTAQGMANLAGVLVMEHQYERAEQQARSAVRAFTQIPHAGNPSVGVAELILGEALMGQKRYKEAVDPLSEAHDVLKASPPTFAKRLEEDRRNLVQLYNALHLPLKAAVFESESTPPQ